MYAMGFPDEIIQLFHKTRPWFTAANIRIAFVF